MTIDKNRQLNRSTDTTVKMSGERTPTEVAESKVKTTSHIIELMKTENFQPEDLILSFDLM